MAEVNLRYTNIISPIDGVVIERSVDIGQTVAASFQAPVLFLLANDLARMQVIAQIDEADIGVISEKARASFTVDAFPGQTFQGKISEIRLSSKLPGSSSTTTTTSTGSASNVVVYNVMIDVDNPQLKLRPGMTANVNFTVASVDNVLRIANSAMRYRPADKSPEEIQKIMAALSGTASADTRTSGGQPDSTAVPVKGPPAGRTMGTQPSTERSTPSGGGSASWQGRMERHSANWSPRATTGGATAIVGPSQTNVYGIDAGMKIRFPSAEDSKAQWTIIWVLDAQGTLQPRRVKLGITDGRQTAVLQGDLKEGEVVVTGELNEDTNQQQRAASPFRGPFGGSGGGARRGGR